MTKVRVRVRERLSAAPGHVIGRVLGPGDALFPVAAGRGGVKKSEKSNFFQLFSYESLTVSRGPWRSLEVSEGVWSWK